VYFGSSSEKTTGEKVGTWCSTYPYDISQTKAINWSSLGASEAIGNWL
jgi:hypothetical protein